MNFLKLYKIPLLFALLGTAFYISFGYDLERSDFVKLISLYGALFFASYLLIEKFKLNFWWLACLGIIFRLFFIISIPNLSQDFYRFIWDGRLLAQGINPYLFTPEQYFEETFRLRSMPTIFNWSSLGINWSVSGADVGQAQKLVEGMGALNASHFSNYPPINQLCFAIAAVLAKGSILGSVVVLRILIILADVGILYFGKKLLEKLQLPVNKIFWYFLNPFIIIELTGNLHFEGVMLFFLVWSFYLLFKGKWIWAAIFIGISVSIKLIPLILLPLFLKYFINPKKASQDFETCEVSKNAVFDNLGKLNRKTLIKFYSVIILTIFITFLPFLSSAFIKNFLSTIALWFQNFEFNASIYYIIRWIGFQFVGWNIIETAGKILPIVVLLLITFLAIFRDNSEMKKMVTGMLFGISFYFLLATTVHPWYIATPLLLCVFTKYRFPIVWSFIVMLSYFAYGKEGFSENLKLVALEYVVVIGFAVWEIFFKKTNLQVSEKLAASIK